MLAPFQVEWDEEVKAGLMSSKGWGRPTIAMATYVRLMVLKHRYGWGYEVLLREVSDSLHLRRFCGIPLHERGPDESTVRKMTKRLGPEAVDGLIPSLIKKATSERRLRLRAGGGPRSHRGGGGGGGGGGGSWGPGPSGSPSRPASALPRSRSRTA